MAQSNGALLQCEGLSKSYSGVQALGNVSLEFRPGEVTGLIGDNGAGKSTLIKILSGVERPDAGRVLMDGSEVRLDTPKRCMNAGIETIYQYNSMVPTMSIARNMFIGREPLKWALGRFGVINRRQMRDEALSALRDVDLHLRSGDALVGELSGGQRQGVAIARAMHFKSRVLILDEPTNHLSVKETKKVLEFVKSLKRQGMTGVFVSHNMQHVFEACERIVVMSLGEVVFDGRVEETSIDEIQTLL